MANTNTIGTEACCTSCNLGTHELPKGALPLAACRLCGAATCGDCAVERDEGVRCGKCHSHNVLNDNGVLAGVMLDMLSTTTARRKGMTTTKLFQDTLKTVHVPTTGNEGDDHMLCWSVYYALKRLGRLHTRPSGPRHVRVFVGES